MITDIVSELRRWCTLLLISHPPHVTDKTSVLITCVWYLYQLRIFGAPEFTPILSGVPVTRSLVLCVMFVYRYLSFW